MRVIGEVFQERPRIRSRQCELQRPDSGQRLEAVEVGVKEDARVADDRDLNVLGVDAPAPLGPGRSPSPRSPGARSRTRICHSHRPVKQV